VWDAFAHFGSATQTLYGEYAGTTSGISITGDVLSIDFPADVTGSGTLSIDAFRLPAASRCDGPSSCKLHVEAARDFATSIP
jgi:hypothetical protein